ncbi:MAG: uL15 family ribosomal protein [Patescibacteria group bacterium]|nr:uL15 family ribosomal protein [Patescibacteria group bacterium]
MQLHELKPIHKNKSRKRVGRGGKRGTYSGRGCKGQKSRAGRRFQPIIRGLIKRYPKLRGYRFKSTKTIPTTVSLQSLEENFKKGEIVEPYVLLDKKLIDKVKGKMPDIKILASGNITKKLIIKDCLISGEAKNKIEKLGGVIKSPTNNAMRSITGKKEQNAKRKTKS